MSFSAPPEGDRKAGVQRLDKMPMLGRNVEKLARLYDALLEWKLPQSFRVF